MVDIDSLSLLGPLLEMHPLASAMPELLPRGRASKEVLTVAEELAKDLPSDLLRAGVWLYVDDLDRSHAISQGLHSPEGSFWHAIMHRREGDFSNSKYWLRQAGATPFELESYDPREFVDQVAAAGGKNPADLLDTQRREWLAMFAHCAAKDVGSG